MTSVDALGRTAGTAPERHPELDEDLSAKQIHLIRTTYRLIGEQGVHRVSLQEIADAAGVSKSLVPYYFKTKENLILTTMRWVLSRVSQQVRDAMAAAETPEQKILAMIDVIFVGPEANRSFYVTYLDLVGHAARVDRFGELSATFRAIVNSLYADVVRSGSEQGAFSVVDVDEAATTLRAIVEGLFLSWLQEEDWRGQHASYRQACKRAVLTSLGARPQAAPSPLMRLHQGNGVDGGLTPPTEVRDPASTDRTVSRPGRRTDRKERVAGVEHETAASRPWAPLRPGLLQVDSDGGGHLLGSRCPSCSACFFPQRRVCARCLYEPLEPTPFSGRGSVYSFTVVHQAPPEFPVPYVLAYVDLPDGVRVLGRVDGAEPEDVRIGMELDFELEPAGEDEEGRRVMSYGFRPRESEEA